MKRYPIGEVADHIGMSASTIRFYEQIGVRFIYQARRLGFSLEEIREIFDFRERGEVPRAYVISRIDKKIGEVNRKISELRRLKFALREMRREADEVSPEEVQAKKCVCHLIENQQLTGGS